MSQSPVFSHKFHVNFGSQTISEIAHGLKWFLGFASDIYAEKNFFSVSISSKKEYCISKNIITERHAWRIKNPGRSDCNQSLNLPPGQQQLLGPAYATQLESDQTSALCRCNSHGVTP